jgi:hypothetical protein
VEIVDPERAPAGTYDVTFREDTTLAAVVWDVVNTVTGDTLLAGQTFQASDPEEFGYPEVDGLVVRVLGPAPGFKRNLRDPSRPMMDEIIAGDGAGGGTPVAPDAFGGPGNDLWWSVNSTGAWGLSAGGAPGDEGRMSRDGTDYVNHTSSDIIVKWDYDFENNWAWWAFTDGLWRAVPFGLYWKDPLTGEETRLIPLINESAGVEGAFDISQDGSFTDGHFNLPATDWIYAYVPKPEYTWQQVIDDVRTDGIFDADPDNDPTTVELFARVVIFANVDPVPPLAELIPSGTVLQFSTTKPNTPLDAFRFTVPRVGAEPGTVVGYDLDQIRVVPNPYLNQSAYELNQFDRVVRFTNLPSVPVTIRIFNLGGELVRSVEKEDPISSVATWDLENFEQIPVASGIYIFHVDAKGVGTHVGKMAVFIEKERLDRF